MKRDAEYLDAMKKAAGDAFPSAPVGFTSGRFAAYFSICLATARMAALTFDEKKKPEEVCGQKMDLIADSDLTGRSEIFSIETVAWRN